MRIQLSALFGLLTFVATSLPVSAAPLSWPKTPTCNAQGPTWELPALWTASTPDLARSMLGRLASPTSHWRFADQALARVSHSPISWIALNASFEASNDFIVLKPGLARPLYTRVGCNRSFTVKAGAAPVLSASVLPNAPLYKDSTTPYKSVSRPPLPTSFPGLGPSSGGTGAPALPSAAPFTFVMDVDDKREPPDPGTPITIVLDPDPGTVPSLTPVPLPNSLALMACAFCLLVGWSRRKP